MDCVRAMVTSTWMELKRWEEGEGRERQERGMAGEEGEGDCTKDFSWSDKEERKVSYEFQEEEGTDETGERMRERERNRDKREREIIFLVVERQRLSSRYVDQRRTERLGQQIALIEVEGCNRIVQEKKIMVK